MKNNSFNKIQWVIGLALTAVVGYSKIEPSTTLSIFLYIIVFLALALIIFTSFIERVVENISYRFKKLYTSFIYNSISVKIEYLKSDGSLVSYLRHDHIENLSLSQKKSIVTLPVEFDGKILRNSISTINSSYTFSSNNLIVFHSVIDDKHTIKKAHHGTHTLCVENAFLNDTEFWILETDRLCRHYYVDIIIPIDKEVVEANVYQAEKVQGETFSIDKERQKKWVLNEEPNILIVRRISSTTINVRLIGLIPTVLYKISWTLKPTSYVRRRRFSCLFLS